MNINERLTELRKLMRKEGVDAYIVVTDDFHGSEYVGDFFKAREFLSGFTGSAGTLVVTMSFAGLWTDGRYFLQAREQLAGTGICLEKMGEEGVPDVAQFLADQLDDGCTVGFDGRTVTGQFVKKIKKEYEKRKKEVHLLWNRDLVGEIWTDRPMLSAEPVWEPDIKYTGIRREEKLRKVRDKMREKSVDVLILTSLDEIAWLLNLRGGDVECTPVFLSFLVIEKESAVLYVNKKIICEEIAEKLNENRITLSDYHEIYDGLKMIEGKKKVMVDRLSANYRILQSLPQDVEVLEEESPVLRMKAVKSAAEMEGMRLAHRKDGVAVTRFLYWLKTRLGKERITELSAAKKLEEFRSSMEGYIGESFTPIMGYAEHGAIVHYQSTKESDAELKPEGFCLSDTGAHYVEGTTDITRTIPLGKLTEEEIRAYTLVLKGHLNLGGAVFKAGISGPNLDYLAREPLWEAGMDYNHGTGHGVGSLLNVHEGPQYIHWRITGRNPVPFEEGMVVSNEPGLYLEGKFGIRHENLVMVRKGEKNQYGQFLYFEPLTMVPFDKSAIDVSLMSEREIERLNHYHQKVYETISPWFSGKELAWLKEMTAPI